LLHLTPALAPRLVRGSIRALNEIESEVPTLFEEPHKTGRRQQVGLVKKLAKSPENHRGAFLPGLWAARSAAALSQRDLAERIGTSQGTIHDLERQGRGAYPKTIRRLSEALDVDPVDLLCAETPEGK
jgi:DNA-binding XRE family transcriptional regulator